MQRMLDAGISTRRGIQCAHREPAYRDLTPRFALPASEHAQDRTIQLPLYHEMTDEDQDRVIGALASACRR